MMLEDTKDTTTMQAPHTSKQRKRRRSKSRKSTRSSQGQQWVDAAAGKHHPSANPLQQAGDTGAYVYAMWNPNEEEED